MKFHFKFIKFDLLFTTQKYCPKNIVLLYSKWPHKSHELNEQKMQTSVSLCCYRAFSLCPCHTTCCWSWVWTRRAITVGYLLAIGNDIRCQTASLETTDRRSMQSVISSRGSACPSTSVATMDWSLPFGTYLYRFLIALGKMQSSALMQHL